MAFLSAVGFHTSRTALQTSRAYSGSVPVKLSGLYSKTVIAAGLFCQPLQKLCPVNSNLFDLIL